MNFNIFKLEFASGIHVGEGKLTDTGFSFLADSMFSALCTEALSLGGQDALDEIAGYAKTGKFLISDGFPYIGDTLYIAKPYIKVRRDDDIEKKKKFKKLEYVPIDQLEEYLAGDLDVDAVNDAFKDFGKPQLFQKNAVHSESDTELYSVGAFRFEIDNGIYFIVGCENEEILGRINELFLSLESSGIGGKRFSGFGKFELVSNNKADFPERLSGDYNSYIALSTCMAKEDELGSALENSKYMLRKRSGYVASSSYSDDGSFLKKKDFYSFRSGSVFQKRFSGDVFDVSDNGNHPVYRYAKGMFMGVNI